jgi:hypothetical protein
VCTTKSSNNRYKKPKKQSRMENLETQKGNKQNRKEYYQNLKDEQLGPNQLKRGRT